MKRLLIALALIPLVACGGEGRDPEPSARAPRPYTVSAIDYHFHDAHPSLPVDLDRGVRFTNQGSNPHNVTFVDVAYSEELPVGGEVAIERIGDPISAPGEYEFFCGYHRDREMTGVLVVRSE